MPWKLQTYIDEDGNRILARWYATLSEIEKAKFNVRVWYLLHQPRDGWTRPQFDTLSDDATGFGEIIVGKVAGVQTRLIGFFSDSSFYVVLVVTKKGNRYDPSNWVVLSKRRKQEIETDSSRANEWIPREPLGAV
jgi:hypothetical protein